MGGVTLQRFWSRLRCLFRRSEAEREMNREMDAHLALMTDDFENSGMPPAQARLAARRAYGGVEQAKELHRDERSFVWLEQFLQDIRHAFRSLRKSPGFAGVTMLSLAFGIGVNAAIFTLIDGILLKQLPVREPHRMVQVMASIQRFLGPAFSYPAYREISRQTRIFEQTVAFFPTTSMLDAGGGPRKIDLNLVTGAYFPLFEATPAVGRLLDAEDDRVEGARRVCVISDFAWKSYFGSDPQIAGRKIRVGGLTLEVVGVTRPDFIGAELQKRYDLWAPTALASELANNRRDSANFIWLRMMGKLRAGVSFAAADAQLRAASQGIESALPKNRANAGATYLLRDAGKGFDTWRSSLQNPLTVVMWAAGLVLLVACANLANLFLARSNERQHQYALQLALGISRWRLLRQLLSETLLVSLGGGLLAIGASYALTQFLVDLFNAGSRWDTMSLSPDAVHLLLFGLGASMLTALLAGLYPALRASRTNAGPGLRVAGLGSSGRGSLRRALIFVQVTLAVVLVFGASLFAHSLSRLKTIPLGYDIDRVLTVTIGEREPGNAELAKSNTQSVASGAGEAAGKAARLRVAPRPELNGLLSRVRGFGGVAAAAYTEPAVLSGTEMANSVTVSDNGQRRSELVFLQMVTPGYLKTVRLPLLRGRDFRESDNGDSPAVALINQHMATVLWPGHDPIGKHFAGNGNVDVEIVGIVGDSKYGELKEQSLSIAYQPFDQMPQSGGILTIRCRTGCSGIERDVRRLVKATAPNYLVANASSMELMRDNQIAQERLLAFLSSLFGALGAALALVGIYGLISYAVTRRTREIGIRVSIGAQRGDVLWLFLRESAILVGAGIAAGLPLALLLTRLISKFLTATLFQVKAQDPASIAITLVLMAAGGLAAAIIPARRAMAIDAVRALRYD